jgi:cation transport ATPase
MGESAAALANEMSDVVIMDSNLNKVLYAIKMGTRVVNTVRENILLSLACKVVVVALTFAGSMTLLSAIASDVGVMLLVTLNGMKLLPGDSTKPWLYQFRTNLRMKYEALPLSSAHESSLMREIV